MTMPAKRDKSYLQEPAKLPRHSMCFRHAIALSMSCLAYTFVINLTQQLHHLHSVLFILGWHHQLAVCHWLINLRDTNHLALSAKQKEMTLSFSRQFSQLGAALLCHIEDNKSFTVFGAESLNAFHIATIEHR